MIVFMCAVTLHEQDEICEVLQFTMCIHSGTTFPNAFCYPEMVRQSSSDSLPCASYVLWSGITKKMPVTFGPFCCWRLHVRSPPDSSARMLTESIADTFITVFCKVLAECFLVNAEEWALCLHMQTTAMATHAHQSRV